MKTFKEAIESSLEKILFHSRWLLAPLYLGLIVTLFFLTLKFLQKLFYIIPKVFILDSPELILVILSLVDVVLIANLLLIIIFSGYENFVSKIDMAVEHVDRPSWMGRVDYSDLKLKVIGSIVAISGIELLKAFINVHNTAKEDIAWMIGLHLTFVVSGVLFAMTEKLAHSYNPHSPSSALPEKEEH